MKETSRRHRLPKTMSARSVLFWCHLAVGIFVGLFVAFLAVTGSLLALEPQILQFAERRLVSGATSGPRTCLSPGQLMVAVQTQIGRPVGTLEFFADSRMPVQVQFGKEEIVFVDPCTGQVLSGGSALQVRAFLRIVRNLHESAAVGHERDSVLRDVKNAANVGFCFLVLSGLVLWIPRRWHRASVRAITTLRWNLRGRARNWNLHNVAGFWLAMPLLAISMTGVLMSYSWAEALLYRVSGSPPPLAHDEHRNRNTEKRPGTERDNDGHPGVEHVRRRGGENEVKQKDGGHGEERPDAFDRALGSAELLGLDGPVEIAKKQVPGWRSLRVRLNGPSGQTVSFAFDDGDAGSGEKGKRPQLRIDRISGRILQGASSAQPSLGDRWRTYARVLHTGQAFGLAGQIVALLASLVALLLVWTGFALSIRRLDAWLKRP